MLHWRYDGTTYLDPVNDSVSTTRANGNITNFIMSKVLMLISNVRLRSEIGALFGNGSGIDEKVSNHPVEPSSSTEHIYADDYMLMPSDDDVETNADEEHTSIEDFNHNDGSDDNDDNYEYDDACRSTNNRRKKAKSRQKKAVGKRQKTNSENDRSTGVDGNKQNGDPKKDFALREFKTTHGLN